jgi:hypothetical protein
MHQEHNAGGGPTFDETRKGAALFHQQMWCWGYDIRRPEGNLLLTYGFKRERPPEGVHGSSAYILHTPERREITLWGFGLFLAQDRQGSLFLPRYGFLPRWSSLTPFPANVWTLAQLPPMIFPQTEKEVLCVRRLFTDLLLEISRYEQWIRETQGEGYRESCIRCWPHVVCPANGMVEAWKEFAVLSERWVVWHDTAQ